MAGLAAVVRNECVKVVGFAAQIPGDDGGMRAPVALVAVRFSANESAKAFLAGLIAEGTTEVLSIEHIDRGYPNIEDKFKALGADIRRVTYSE